MIDSEEEKVEELQTTPDKEYVIGNNGHYKSYFTTGRVAIKSSRSGKKRTLVEMQPVDVFKKNKENPSFNIWVDPNELFMIDPALKPFQSSNE